MGGGGGGGGVEGARAPSAPHSSYTYAEVICVYSCWRSGANVSSLVRSIEVDSVSRSLEVESIPIL